VHDGALDRNLAAEGVGEEGDRERRDIQRTPRLAALPEARQIGRENLKSSARSSAVGTM
jgi:hypothetical protein